MIFTRPNNRSVKVHKEMLGQTDFLREILLSTKEHCCGTIEVICPCSKEELNHLVNFLYDGEIHCENESDSLKVIENLQKIFGFPRNLDLCYPNQTFFASVTNIEAMTITEEVFEDILDDPNAEKVDIISLMRKDESSGLVATDQGKEDNVLDNGEKNVPKKKKKSKKISGTKVKGSSMKKYENKFNCNDCGASFLYKSWLQKHINTVHLKIANKFNCNDCGASFIYKSQLQMHINAVHLKLKPYECDLCAMSFARKGDLTNEFDLLSVTSVKKNSLKCIVCIYTIKLIVRN